VHAFLLAPAACYCLGASVGAHAADGLPPGDIPARWALVQEDQLSQPPGVLPLAPPADAPLAAFGDAPASQLTISIAPRDREIPIVLDAARPLDVARQRLAIGESQFLESPILPGDPWAWDVLSMGQFCHRPLYLDDTDLERYGCCHPHCQSAASAAHFFASVALLPIELCLQHPHDCVSTPHPLE
jgi:hypothetical protein